MLIVLTFVALAAPAAPAGGDTFCHRLAPLLDMKQSASTQIWSRETAGLKDYFLGGAWPMSMALGALPDATPADYVRLAGGCKLAKRGAICVISGPGYFRINFKKLEISQNIETHDHSEVRVRNTLIECEDR